MTSTSQAPLRSRCGAGQRLRALGVESSGHCLRMIAEDDLVVVQARFTGYADASDFTGFEIIRLDGGAAVERWVALQPAVGAADGSYAPDHAEHPEQGGLSRRLVDYYTDHVLIGGDGSSASRFVVADVIQHVQAPSGAVAPPRYRRRRLTVAEGEFAFVVCTGGVGDRAVAFYDLYRLDRAMIVEHWSVLTPMPDRLPCSRVRLARACL